MHFKLTLNFIADIKSLVINNEDLELLKLFDSLLPPDLAEILMSLELKYAKYVFNLLSDEMRANILIELEEELREKLLEELSSKEIAKEVVEKLDSDDAADVIQELSEIQKREVLSNITDKKQANNIVNLLSYHDNSAGALMATELIKVYENWSVLRCVSEMRKQAEDVHKVYTIYVLSKKNILIGTVSLKKLLLTPEKTFISEIYNENIISVNANSSGEEVATLMKKYDLIVLPVIDENQNLIGRITIDDVIDFIKEEADKDYQMASGIIDSIEPLDGIWTLTKARIPWLIVGMIGGLMGAEIIGLFHIEENPVLAFFIPLIAAMGGNVGVQSSAIIVQGLASNSLEMDNWSRRFFKEFGVALINGLICCLLLFVVCIFLYPQPNIPIMVSISLFTVMLFASLFGTFVPLALNKYGIDPALATGPFITTMNDVIGLFIYFSIAQLIL